MKAMLRKIFAPLLHIFEKGDEDYIYQSKSRVVLIIMGTLFGILSTIVTAYIIYYQAYSYFLPAIIFSGVAFVALVVGSLGTERGVAKIWGTKK